MSTVMSTLATCKTSLKRIFLGKTVLNDTRAGTFAADDRGATAIEYSLIASGIAAAIAATITTLGTSVEQLWKAVGGIFG